MNELKRLAVQLLCGRLATEHALLTLARAYVARPGAQAVAQFHARLDELLPKEYRSASSNTFPAALAWVRLHCELVALREVYDPTPKSIAELFEAEIRRIQPAVHPSVLEATRRFSGSPNVFTPALSVMCQVRAAPQFLAPTELPPLFLVPEVKDERIPPLIKKALNWEFADYGWFSRSAATHAPFLECRAEDRPAQVIPRVRSWWDAFEEVPAECSGPGCVRYGDGVHGVILRDGSRLIRRDRYAFFTERAGRNGKASLVYRPRSKESTEKITGFFESCRPRRRLIEMGFQALLRGNFKMIDSTDVLFPTTNEALTGNEFELRWKKLSGQIRPGDLLLVRDTSSVVSSAIATLDGGSWSHAAWYVGNGQISEVDTDYIGIRGMDTLCDARYRLGVYRPLFALPALQRQPKVSKYSYSKACWAGLRSLLLVKSSPPTPNGLVYSGEFYPVCFV